MPPTTNACTAKIVAVMAPICRNLSFVLCLSAGLLAGCGGGGGGGGETFVVVLEQQPPAGEAGTELSAFTVHTDDAQGNFLASDGLRITISLASTGTLGNGRQPGLSGTLTRTTINGRALFNDIVLTGAANDYVFRFSGGGSSDESNQIDIAPASPWRVAFLSSPRSTPVGGAIPDFQVAVIDRWDNIVRSAANRITVELAAVEPFARDVLLHASGVGQTNAPVDDAPFEFIDCDGPFVLPPEPIIPFGEVDALAFDEGNTNLVWGTTMSGSVFTYDPFLGNGLGSGQLRQIGAGLTLSQRYKGLYFDGGGDLWGLPFTGSEEVPISKTSGIDNPASSLAITISGDVALGYRGTAVDPITGNLYAGAILASDPTGPVRLIVIDGNNDASVRGPLAQGCASLATKFDSPGFRLYAVSPDGGAIPPTLYAVNPLTASMTSVQTLGNGTAGEAITYVFPAPATLTAGGFEATPFQGIATFSGWRWDLLIEGMSLRATSPGLNPDVSSLFDITTPDTTALVTMATGDQSVGEAVGTISFTVALSKAVAHDVVVVYDSNGPAGTATPGADSDLFGVSTVTIPAGQTQASVSFTIKDDGAPESDEFLAIRLTGASMATLGTDTELQIRIADND